MPVNRIFTQQEPAPVATPAVPSAAAAGMPMVMVLVADPTRLAAWQQIYQVAAERARVALEPPRHHRLFTVWN